jgi:chromosome segregation ATPase
LPPIGEVAEQIESVVGEVQQKASETVEARRAALEDELAGYKRELAGKRAELEGLWREIKGLAPMEILSKGKGLKDQAAALERETSTLQGRIDATLAKLSALGG